MSMLNSLPQVTGQGELFLPRPRVSDRRWDSDFAIPRFIETESDSLKIRPLSVFSYLDALYRTSGSVGFKLMYAQLARYPEILAYFIRHRTNVVHLVRQNHLDVEISYAVKAKIGRAHLLSGQPSPQAMHVELETQNLVARLERLQQKQQIARKILSWSKLPHLEVAYEDLLRDQAHFRIIWDFLSIEPQQAIPEAKLVKIRRGEQHETITNYDEVKNLLAYTKYAGLLE